MNDTDTKGFENQFATSTGTGVGGSGNYAVCYYSSWDPIPSITLPIPTTVTGFSIANTTYAALEMTDGSSYSKQFGGSTGNDPDWLKLTITGKNQAGVATGSLNFFMADFRFANNAQDYILSGWNDLDLSSLGASVKTLEFTMDSSEYRYGSVATPTYFAMDNLQVAAVPEPTGLALMGLVGGFILRRRIAK